MRDIIKLVDILLLLMYAFFAMWWKSKSAKIAEEIEKENITIGDYSIYVTGYPL